MSNITHSKIKITGIVQGVGFRPFVYGLAKELDLKGWVRNTSAGVDIEIEGTANTIDDFIKALNNGATPLSRIDTINVDYCEPQGFVTFEILHSEPIPGAFIPISPDVSICSDCLQELFDPSDPRYHYPFINCTNCGPRFTIIKDIPYDRPKTTMGSFKLCEFCQSEYENPLNRRFHAQPVACPTCGPHVWLEINQHPQDAFYRRDAIVMAVQMLAQGKIIAIKGLGGFHLSCDALNSDVVDELRRRKLRVDKPFALMFPDIETVTMNCYINDVEKSLIISKERPIVLLKRKPGSKIAQSVAPGQDTLGVMLPYTPLHYLLFGDPKRPNKIAQIPTALVMTSGNLSEEPIAYKNHDAVEQLKGLADAFLMHNREIHMRTDDSVVRLGVQPDHKPVEASYCQPVPYFIRRSRGYAPNSIPLTFESSQTLAVGPEQKNTFCLLKDHYAFLSHHIGDMENYETLKSFEEGINHYENLFRIKPLVLACDLHPNYLSTRYALERAASSGLQLFQIQHHHAHIAACMADNELKGDHSVIGISFDGTGLGTDDAIWGGEFLISDYIGYHRFAHLEYSPLPGGDAATKNPYRIALAQLWYHDIDWDRELSPVLAACGDDLSLLRSMLEKGINTPLTSSIGRLFDSVSSLIGIRNEVNYEAQAAIELEATVDIDEEGSYPFEIKQPFRQKNMGERETETLILGTRLLFQAIIEDIHIGTNKSRIAAKFHNGLANITLETCRLARKLHGIDEVALSGGVWQNMVLLKKTYQLLEKNDFVIYLHKNVPTNDGGLALGQAVIASMNHKKITN